MLELKAAQSPEGPIEVDQPAARMVLQRERGRRADLLTDRVGNVGMRCS